MIDFISSDPSADPQTVACARLLAAVIARAIEDASGPQYTVDESLSAIAWLFEESSSFEEYAKLIGASASAMRSALLAETGDFEPKNSSFSSSKRRHVRMVYKKWLGIRAQALQAIQKTNGHCT
jgi:hypothetical protein